MANERLIKDRINSAKNISQITKAMQMVAASKMRKAQQAAVSGRPYAEKIAKMTAKFVTHIGKKAHPLLRVNPEGKTLIVLVSTNKGLLGGLNANLFRKLLSWFTRLELESADIVTVGKKGKVFIVRQQLALVADFSQTVPFAESISALTTLITTGYTDGVYRNVYLVYNNFISALNQEPERKKILPISEFTSELETAKVKDQDDTPLDFIVEPAVDEILDTLLFHYLENQIRDAILEAEASEHSARMMAMKNATDNANELVELLTLEYNKARQEKITYEIADMVTARLAVED